MDTLLAEIMANTTRTDDGAMVTETMDAQALVHVFGSDVRSTALVISALLEVDPKNPLIPDLAQGLKEKRSKQGYWRNTQDNVYALTGLADFARASGSGKATVSIFAGDKQLSKKTISGTKVVRLSKALTKLEQGRLRIESSSPLYYSARLSLAHEPTTDDATSNGLAIERQYHDFETDQPIAKAKVGQLVRVRVKVSAEQSQQHIAVVDPIPSGFEIVNLKLKTEALQGDTSASRSRSRYRYWYWTHNELRDDRAMVFANRFYGTRTFEYVLRAIRPGRFSTPGAHAEAMYEPTTFARTIHQEFKISER